jgi:hypothetical protein
MRLWIIALTALAVLAFTPDASHARTPHPAALQQILR